jgi:Na+/glutamate symporter
MQLTQKWLRTSDLKTTNSVKKKKQSTYPSPKKFKKQKGSKIVKLVLPCRCITHVLPSWLAGLLACFLPSFLPSLFVGTLVSCLKIATTDGCFVFGQISAAAKEIQTSTQ